MNIKKALRLNGTLLDKRQLESHLEKIATDHNLKPKSQKDTYPVPDMIENYKFIKEVYNLSGGNKNYQEIFKHSK